MAGEARTGNIYVYIYYFINLIFMLLQNITKKKKKAIFLCDIGSLSEIQALEIH